MKPEIPGSETRLQRGGRTRMGAQGLLLTGGFLFIRKIISRDGNLSASPFSVLMDADDSEYSTS